MKTTVIDSTRFVEIYDAIADMIVTEFSGGMTYEGCHPKLGPVVLVVNTISDDDTVLITREAA
jgi:hypothetical protein